MCFLLLLLNLLLSWRSCCHPCRDCKSSLICMSFLTEITLLARVTYGTCWSLSWCGCRRINRLDYFQNFNCEVTKSFIIIHGVSQFSKPFICGDRSFKEHLERDYHTAFTVKNMEKKIRNEEITSEWIKRTRVQASVLQTLVWSLLSRRILHHHHTACPAKMDQTKHAETG